MIKEGKCKYGDSCCFYHSEEDRRNLIDPLPELPKGTTLPPLPICIRNNKYMTNNYNNRFQPYLTQKNMFPPRYIY